MSLKSYNYKLRPYNAYYKARFIKVIYILVLNAILCFYISYKLKLYANNLRIFLLCSLVIIYLSLARFKLI